MSEINLVIEEPSHGDRFTPGADFTTEVSQQSQAPYQEGSATLQFSNHSDGPWETCRAPGEGGEVEAETVPWHSDMTKLALASRFNAPAWVRPAAWVGQGGTEGAPDHQGPAIRLKGLGHAATGEHRARSTEG